MKTSSRTSPESAPTIWFNVTSSSNWTRPPVGVIRVEQNIFKALTELYGPERCVPCVWADDGFVRWEPDVKKGGRGSKSDAATGRMVRNVMPSTPSFDLSYKYVYKLVKALRAGGKKPAEQVLEDITRTFKMSPSEGDILVTMGLDWDHGYKERLYDIRRRRNVKVVTCCYDLIPVLYPQYCVGEVSRYFKEYFYNLAWASDGVLCISKQTERDFRGMITESGMPDVRTAVIELGDNIPAQKEDDEIGDAIALLADSEYILFVSTIERRKNHEVLYRAYHLLIKAGHKKLPKLVFVGMRGWGVDELFSDLRLDPILGEHIVVLDHLTDAELLLLFKKTLFCVYPSLYEGWGLPVGEALSLGKFVLSSDRASLPEVGGDLVTYVDPWNPQAWADEILRLVDDRALLRRKEARVRKAYRPRDWTNTGTQVKALIDDLFAQKRNKWVLQPGYDCSSFVGLQDRGDLRTTGHEGFLMYGPHFSLGAGRYAISVHATIRKATAGAIKLDVAADGAETILQKFAFAGTVGKQVAAVEVDVPAGHADLEVRCMVTAAADLSLHMVTITRM